MKRVKAACICQTLNLLQGCSSIVCMCVSHRLNGNRSIAAHSHAAYVQLAGFSTFYHFRSPLNVLYL